MKRIVGPAFWIVAAAGQWGPEYAAWDDGRVWDVLIRFVLSMAFACMAVKGIRANKELSTNATTSARPGEQEG